jgi:sporulation protein YlmC with PRC-barrel domain
MSARRVDLLREVLDHEVVDADGVACGMVDDIEFRSTPQGPVVAALLLGPGAWSTRLPALLRLLAQRVFGREVMHVPWSEVVQIGEVIRLRSRAAELGLGRLDRKVGRWLTRLPMS